MMKMDMMNIISVFCFLMLSSAFIQSQRVTTNESNAYNTETHEIISQENSTSMSPDGNLSNKLVVTLQDKSTIMSTTVKSPESSTTVNHTLKTSMVSVSDKTGDKSLHTSVTISPADTTVFPVPTNASTVVKKSTLRPYATANTKEATSFYLYLQTLSSPSSTYLTSHESETRKTTLKAIAFKTTKTEFSTAKVSESTEAYTQYTGSLYSILTSPATVGRKFNLKNSEIILTIIFSIVLGVAVLVLIMYSVNKCKKRREQYSHHRLETMSCDDTADRYSIPDDTLVISGGLYDAPRVYNPTVSTLEDDNMLDYLHFTSRPGNFRLEFLPEETEKEPSNIRTNSETFT